MILIKRVGLTAEYSPKDELLAFLKVMRIRYDGFDQVTEVPKKVRELLEEAQTEFIP